MRESMRIHPTMRNLIVKVPLLGALLAAALACASAAAAEGEGMQSAQVKVGNIASLQRGARVFFNYCSGCHSIKYMNYARLAEDLQLTKKEVLENFAFGGAKIGDQIETNMPAEDAKKWFGKAPPDLSLEARAKGPDWIFNYLKSFYLDPTGKTGWNNTVFPNASMPNPLWELQGVQVAHKPAAKPGEEAAVEKLEIAQKGRQSPAEFDETARDVTAFLTYVGEPAALQRASIGVWVILFLVFLTFITWMLKHEFWRDVH